MDHNLNIGPPKSLSIVCVALHKDVKRLDEEAAASGGRALFGNDDGYVIGPRVEAKAALDNFRDRIWTRCGLRLQEEKTELFSGRDLNQEELFGMKKAGVMLEDGFAPGFICYGFQYIVVTTGIKLTS